MTDDPVAQPSALTRVDIMALIARNAPQHLIDCDLEDADLSALNLSGWTFERCVMRRTNFGGAKLEQTQWRSCRGAFANFLGADLTEARLSASDFNNAIFRRAFLTSAGIDSCKLTGADLSEARAMDVIVTETLLINAKLPAWSFRKLTLNRIDFSQADLRKCDFRAVTFSDCSLRDAHMTGARFEGADLRGADLGGLRLMDAAMFRGATISREQAGQLLGELGLNVH